MSCIVTPDKIDYIVAVLTFHGHSRIFSVLFVDIQLHVGVWIVFIGPMLYWQCAYYYYFQTVATILAFSCLVFIFKNCMKDCSIYWYVLEWFVYILCIFVWNTHWSRHLISREHPCSISLNKIISPMVVNIVLHWHVDSRIADQVKWYSLVSILSYYRQ